jgi:hypothetical protein
VPTSAGVAMVDRTCAIPLVVNRRIVRTRVQHPDAIRAERGLDFRATDAPHSAAVAVRE